MTEGNDKKIIPVATRLIDQKTKLLEAAEQREADESLILESLALIAEGIAKTNLDIKKILKRQQEDSD